MSVQPVLPAGRVLERLFTPGARLGWSFRDRRELAAHYPEPSRILRNCASRWPNGLPQRSPATQGAPLGDQAQPGPRLRLILLMLAGYAKGRNKSADADTTVAVGGYVPCAMTDQAQAGALEHAPQ